jgi:hypothetical protein
MIRFPEQPAPPRRRPCLLALAGALAGLTLGCHSIGLNLLSRDRADRPETAGPPLPAPPGRLSFRVAPYVFLSDFELNRDQPLFKDLEGLRDQVYRELQLPPGRAVVQVYLFETKQRYDQFMAAHYPKLPNRRAFFVAQQRPMGGTEDLLVYTFWGGPTPAGSGPEPTPAADGAGTPAPDLQRIQQDLRHELTHALLHSVIRVVPLWLDEGLAEYFELPPERKGVNPGHLEALRRDLGVTFKPDLARLEKLEDVKDMDRPEYREAWAWVHLMLHSRPEARTVLLTYLQDLRGNRNPGLLGPRLAAVFPTPEQAFTKHLSEIEPPATALANPPAPPGKAPPDPSAQR